MWAGRQHLLRGVAASLLASMVLAATPIPSHGQGTGETARPGLGSSGSTVDDDNDTLGTWVQVVDGQGNISYEPEGGGGGGGTQSAVYWRVSRVSRSVVPDVVGFANCERDGQAGQWVRYELVDRATGVVLQSRMHCLLDGEDPASGLPDVEPPSVEEVLQATAIPQPSISVNPDTEGITGMETWLWAEGAETTVESDVELRGWSVHATLDATEWVWSVEGETYTSAGPGNADEPAATHVFDTKGTHEITVEVTWTGGYVVEGYGITYEVAGLAASTTGSLDYTVVEVVSVVDEPGTDDD